MRDFYFKCLLGCLSLSLLTACNPQSDPIELPDPDVVLPLVEAAAADKDAYRAALAGNDRAAYQSYLDGFPDGRFRAEVQEHLIQIDNREAQATYAYDMVLQTLEAVGKPPRVHTPNVGTYVPTVNQTLTQVRMAFAERLNEIKQADPQGLPNNYLDYLDDKLRRAELYTAELNREYEQYVRKLLGGSGWTANIRKAFAGPHLARCQKAQRAYAARFRRQGAQARVALGEYRMTE